MHGLVLKSLQTFLTDVYAPAVWDEAAATAGLPDDRVEAMMLYDDARFERLVSAAASALSKPRDALLEDLGTCLVSHPSMARIRRLLRFGGADYVDFVESLDDLPGRARLAVPDLALPSLRVRAAGPGLYRVTCSTRPVDLSPVLRGVLRAMADDYGALAVVEPAGGGGDSDGTATLRVRLLSCAFARGRDFALGAQAG